MNKVIYEKKNSLSRKGKTYRKGKKLITVKKNRKIFTEKTSL